MGFHAGRSFGTAAVAALVSLTGAVAGAQSPQVVPPADRRPPNEVSSLALPSPALPDRAVHASRRARPRPIPTGPTDPNDPTDPRIAGRLKAWTAQGLRDGEGRLVIDGVAHVVKPGQSVEGYVVKAVSPGRVVLQGPAPGAGQPAASVLAFLTFDAQGRSRVGLVFESDPTAALSAPPPGH